MGCQAEGKTPKGLTEPVRDEWVPAGWLPTHLSTLSTGVGSGGVWQLPFQSFTHSFQFSEDAVNKAHRAVNFSGHVGSNPSSTPHQLL